MSQSGEQPKIDRGRYTFNLALAAVVAQVGCLTTSIIILALILGLWLDNQFQVRPTFTILLLVISVPVTLAMMLWIVRKATARIQENTEAQSKNSQE